MDQEVSSRQEVENLDQFGIDFYRKILDLFSKIFFDGMTFRNKKMMGNRKDEGSDPKFRKSFFSIFFINFTLIHTQLFIPHKTQYASKLLFFHLPNTLDEKSWKLFSAPCSAVNSIKVHILHNITSLSFTFSLEVAVGSPKTGFSGVTVFQTPGNPQPNGLRLKPSRQDSPEFLYCFTPQDPWIRVSEKRGFKKTAV